MSKYIIELFDGVQVLTGVGASPSGTVWSKSYDVDELEELNSDYINENFGELQDEAYQRGFEDGKKSGYEKGLNAVGTYRKGYAIGYDEGYEDGKNSYDKNKTYQRGLEDAWEAAKKLFSSMADSDIEKAFPIEWNNGGFKALMNLQPQEAIAKLKAYEDKRSDRIEVGDVVERYIDGKFDSRGIYLQEEDGYWRCLFDTNGVLMTFAYPKGQFKKTGKHYDIASILEAMKS